jgi:uncharacterized membrane protein YpjA
MTMHYIKDRTESFDDYFPFRIKNCKLKHVWNCINLFIDYHNKELKAVKRTALLSDNGYYVGNPDSHFFC